MLDGKDNLTEMSLRLNELVPDFQTLQEKPGEQRSNDGLIYYMIVRRKPEQVFVFRILYAVNLDLKLFEKNLFKNLLGAL